MADLEIKRNGRTNQFSIVLVQGTDTIRCMVSVASGGSHDARSDQVKEQAALKKAKELAQILDTAIGEEPVLRSKKRPPRRTDEEIKARALDRWDNEGGAPRPAKRSRRPAT
jgi:hypothetical protein